MADSQARGPPAPPPGWRVYLLTTLRLTDRLTEILLLYIFWMSRHFPSGSIHVIRFRCPLFTLRHRCNILFLNPQLTCCQRSKCNKWSCCVRLACVVEGWLCMLVSACKVYWLFWPHVKSGKKLGIPVGLERFKNPFWLLNSARFTFHVTQLYLSTCHPHHVTLLARISLTLSRHSSLSSIAPGRSSRQHPVSAQSYCRYILAGPTFARLCEGLHRSTSLMSSSLLLQQCPAYLVRFTCMVFVMCSRWSYSCCFEGCCVQDLFNTARNILA